MRASWAISAILAALWGCAATASERPIAPRHEVSLDGTWEIAEGGMDQRPAAFDRKVPVPGLVDMAAPAFEEVGTPSSRRQAFWYRKTFDLEGALPAVARLRIGKARYGTHVWLNGQDLGEHVGCFTGAEFDVKGCLKGEGAANELVVRVGADRKALAPGTPDGWDFEKCRYIPGIYDSVRLVLTGYPYIRNVQIVPNVAASTVRAVVEVQNGPRAVEAPLTAEVSGAKDAAVVVGKDAAARPLQGGEIGTSELCVSIADMKTWSPESPYLYAMTVGTGGDALQVRFGMREFRFDPVSKRAMLNGKPYYLRGTNICIYRFFEDPQRGDKPWRDEWVRRLHEQFQWMHWNSIRYCIGFPPERWYDIADELGLLIQDEFPIWSLSPDPKDDRRTQPKAELMIPQYTEWMRERWNHPCVVIWDAQNESNLAESGKAIRAVRSLDLSNRPWENGWSAPQSATDCVESHPYLFIREAFGGKAFRLSELAGLSGKPDLNEAQKSIAVPIIINEYCWLWLNRDGTTTTLTQKIYESALGAGSTTAQRRLFHARGVAALTEFWRCHREAAGVLHFCGLGYSRPGGVPGSTPGQTSDHWIDLEALTYEPLIAEYVKESFNPVGLMVNFWDEKVSPETTREVEVYAINDLEASWKGAVVLSVLRGEQVVAEWSQDAAIEPNGRTILKYGVSFPREPGDYVLRAQLQGAGGERVRSLRDFKIAP